jgi:hypothetical protein
MQQSYLEQYCCTVKDIVQKYPAFSEATIRWWIFQASTNGFDKCIIKIGGRIYIDQMKFDEWIREHYLVPLEIERID